MRTELNHEKMLNHFYVLEVDMEGRYTFINAIAAKTFGLDPKKCIGTDSLDTIVPEDHQKTYDATMRCIASGETIQQVFIRKPTPQGVITNEWEFDLIKDDTGIPTGIRCTGFTVAGILSLKESIENEYFGLQKKFQEQRGIINMLSHDLRSPIKNIRGLLELHDTDAISTEELLNRIQSTVDGLNAKLEAINEHMKVQTLNLEHLEKVNFRQILVQVISLVRSDVRAIEAELIAQGEDVFFKSDPLYLQSILHNLISNAIKYRKDSEPLIIEVNWKLKGDQLHFSVLDNGQGIDLEKHRADLFTPFKSFHEQSDSNGFGLFSIQQLIRQLGGSIDVESELGVFTQFNVRLPIEPTLPEA